jgi:hypothetical protein
MDVAECQTPAVSALAQEVGGFLQRGDTRLCREKAIYGFPIIAGYKTMYEFAIDKFSRQCKASFHQMWNESHAFTANSDTPCSMLWTDLRTELLVLCAPESKKADYSV